MGAQYIMKVLILTVGGSDTPVVNCIKNYHPNYVVFLCTEDNNDNMGSRKMIDGGDIVKKERPCKRCNYENVSKKDNIVNQCGLSNDYAIHVVPHDDPNKCYETAFNLIKNFISEGHEITVDYTGGTKSMSVGLAVAAMEFPQCNLSVVKGIRQDLDRIRDGMEVVSRLPSHAVFTKRQKRLCRDLISQYNYAAAVRILEELSTLGFVDDEKYFRRQLILCRSFAAWDKFDYHKTVKMMNIYKTDSLITEYYAALRQICATLEWYGEGATEIKKAPPVFMLVYDVLLNAERRAYQGHYDDAVSRMYRALEMYGQFCLRTGEPQLTSEDVDVSLIPEQHREYYEKKRGARGKIQIGLIDDYELLAILGHPVKQLWESWRDKIKGVLNKRNNSFLAHGMKPISCKEYTEMKEIIWGFISGCDKIMTIRNGFSESKQFPLEI